MGAKFVDAVSRFEGAFPDNQSRNKSLMLSKTFHFLAIGANHGMRAVEACILRMRRVSAIACFLFGVWGLVLGSNLSAATVPAGFTESPIAGPWNDAVGLTFE